jgi:hypothetical protein
MKSPLASKIGDAASATAVNGININAATPAPHKVIPEVRNDTGCSVVASAQVFSTSFRPASSRLRGRDADGTTRGASEIWPSRLTLLSRFTDVRFNSLFRVMVLPSDLPVM